VAFATITDDDKAKNKTDDEDKAPRKNAKHITCYNCDTIGHYRSDCPKKTGTGMSMLMAASRNGDFDGDYRNYEPSGYSFHQPRVKDIVPQNWILLDNQSTVNVFSNKHLLTNIRESDESMSIMCNAGLAKMNLIGDLPGYGEVWFNPNGIANILSMSEVEKDYPITYENQTFTIHKDADTKRHFTKSKQGRYYMDTEESIRNTGVVLVETVADKKSKYSNKDYSQTVLARKVQDMIGRPSLKTCF
jgi:hypothetical protein